MSSLLSAIGKTPLVQSQRVVPANAARVFVKLEYYNPTGSYKDRMALSVIEGAGYRRVAEEPLFEDPDVRRLLGIQDRLYLFKRDQSGAMHDAPAV